MSIPALLFPWPPSSATVGGAQWVRWRTAVEVLLTIAEAVTVGIPDVGIGPENIDLLVIVETVGVMVVAGIRGAVRTANDGKERLRLAVEVQVRRRCVVEAVGICVVNCPIELAVSIQVERTAIVDDRLTDLAVDGHGRQRR